MNEHPEHPQKEEPKGPIAPDLWAAVAPKNRANTATVESGWERGVLEKLVLATIREQRATRRWRIFFRLAWLLLLGAILWMVFSRDMSTAAISTPHTAVVEIKGVIDSDGDASAEVVMAAMRSAFEDSGSKGVVLLINSPGGSPVQAGMINDEITRLKAKHNKPVYAVVEETCASAAYYIAAATDQIFVDKASIVGSIGVLMDGFGFTGTMEKLGVERRLLTAGENKGFLDPFSPLNDKQRVFAQHMLNEIHTQFIAVVKAGRGSRLADNPDIFSGLFWTGQHAIDLGLADHLGSLDEVARNVVKAEEVVDYTRRGNVVERFAKRFGVAMGASAVRTMQSNIPQLR